MKILLLGPLNEKISDLIREDGHQVVEKESPIDVQFLIEKQIDFAVSYGYRHIIKSDVLHHLKDRIINLHISYLPWNRGADPNLWSFLEDTPKGVTIHYVDEEIDTGDIIVQKEVVFEHGAQTLSTTYARLQDEMMLLFKSNWPLISIGGGTPVAVNRQAIRITVLQTSCISTDSWSKDGIRL